MTEQVTGREQTAVLPDDIRKLLTNFENKKVRIKSGIETVEGYVVHADSWCHDEWCSDIGHNVVSLINVEHPEDWGMLVVYHPRGSPPTFNPKQPIVVSEQEFTEKTCPTEMKKSIEVHSVTIVD